MTLDEALRVAIEALEAGNGVDTTMAQDRDAAAVLERLRGELPVYGALGRKALQIADDAMPVRGDRAHASLFNIFRTLGTALASLDPPSEERT